MNTARRTTVAVLALVLAAIAAPQLASAHARYKASTPGTSEVVQISPPQVDITFTQEIQKVAGNYAMTVTSSTNAVVSSGPAVINDQDRTQMSVPLAPNLPPGRYVVNWNNVSDADGHYLTGAFAFYVVVQPTAADRAADAVLATIGAPTSTDTPTTGASPTAPTATGLSATAPATAGTAAASPATTGPVTGPATVLASPTAASSGGSGSSNTGLFIGVGVVVAAVLVAGGGWVFMQRKRT
jgi:copper resistance protein C